MQFKQQVLLTTSALSALENPMAAFIEGLVTLDQTCVFESTVDKEKCAEDLFCDQSELMCKYAPCDSDANCPQSDFCLDAICPPPTKCLTMSGEPVDEESDTSGWCKQPLQGSDISSPVVSEILPQGNPQAPDASGQIEEPKVVTKPNKKKSNSAY